MVKLCATAQEAIDKWNGKYVTWKHPYSNTTNHGMITTAEFGAKYLFLIVKDGDWSEGILESWILYTTADR